MAAKVSRQTLFDEKTGKIQWFVACSFDEVPRLWLGVYPILVVVV